MDINYNESLPSSLIKLIKEHVDDDTSQFLLQEINNTISLEYSTPPLVDEGKTFGNWTTGLLPDFTRDYRNYLDQLSFEIIEQMIKSSPVRFAVEMKRAQIVSVFRNQRSWKINCVDKELGDVVRANLINILSKMALDFSYSSLVYGVSFQELVWEYKTKSELGLQEEVGGDKYVVAKVPNAIDPKTIDYIKRDKKGHFGGFVQKPISVLTNKEIVVERESALVIPYNEKWRNLWGESFLAPMYPIWFWYEVVLRSMVKYMERTGTPVVKVRAPSRATITKPGTKTKIDGISWGMEIGSNLPRSNTVVIPSDRDEQGNPLWEIDYMSSTERAQPFMDILELLFQMILRAGLSADRALSQSSGGVGSYSIGEIHKEATALHNEMILIQWVYYLNQYFLPLYSLYNRGTNGPVITIETQGLDPFDRDNLKTILGVMQGSESFKNVSYKIDWDSLFTTNNVPTISDEEAEAKKKKQQEEALSNQENMLSVQSKFSTPSPTKQADGSLKANLPKKPPEKKLENDNEDAIELEQIDLFNPYHDRKDGKFASSKGTGLFGSAVNANRNKEALEVVSAKANTSPNRLFKTTGLILGLGGLGIVGYALLKPEKQYGPFPSDGTSQNENLTQEKRLEMLAKYNDLVSKYQDNVSRASIPKGLGLAKYTAMAREDLKNMGIEEIYDGEVNIASGDALSIMRERNSAGMFMDDQFFITPEWAAALEEGDKFAYSIVVHELAHSNQENYGEWDNFERGFSRMLGNGYENLTPLAEGQNDLYTRLAISQRTNTPESTAASVEKQNNLEETYSYLSNIYNNLGDLQSKASKLPDEPNTYMAWSGYKQENYVYAGLVMAAMNKGISPKQFLNKYHSAGLTVSGQAGAINEVFPGKASAGVIGVGSSLPSQAELIKLLNDENIDLEKSYEDLMQMAAEGRLD